MAGKRIVIPNYMPALDLNGGPVAGAKLYFYDNETTTLKAIYTSAALSVAHANPVIASAAGVFPSIFADEAEEFSVAITDADDNPITGLRNRDNITPSLNFLDGVAAPVSDAVAATLVETTLAAFRTAVGTDLAANVNFTPTGTGAVARTAQAKFLDIVSVKDFGVIGDGSDETTEIQAAIDAVEASGGGRLYFPPCSGFYGFTNLTMGHRVILCGQGFTEYSNAPPSSYLKRVTGSTGVGITITGDASGFENAHIDGNDLGTDLVQVIGGRFVLRDTSTSQAGRDNLRIGSDTTSNTYNMNLWRITNLVSLDAGRYGLYVHDAKSSLLPDVNGGMLVGCDIRSCVNHGIYFEQAWDNTLYGAVCQNNGGTGLRLGGLCDSITAFWPYLEANANNECVLDSGATTCVVMGNRSGTVATGYVDNSGNLTNTLYFYRPSTGQAWSKSLTIFNSTASGSADLNLIAGTNEIVAGVVVGREGSLGASDGEMALQVRQTGNIPLDRLVLTDGAVVVPTGTDLKADKLSDQSGVQLVGARVTGFGAMTGTATKTAIATYTAPDIEATYTEATIQALADAVQALSRRVKAQDDALLAHGLIGA